MSEWWFERHSGFHIDICWILSSGQSQTPYRERSMWWAMRPWMANINVPWGGHLGSTSQALSSPQITTGPANILTATSWTPWARSSELSCCCIPDPQKLQSYISFCFKPQGAGINNYTYVIKLIHYGWRKTLQWWSGMGRCLPVWDRTSGLWLNAKFCIWQRKREQRLVMLIRCKCLLGWGSRCEPTPFQGTNLLKHTQ